MGVICLKNKKKQWLISISIKIHKNKKFYDDNATLTSEAKYRAMKREGVKTVSEARIMKERGVKILPP